MQLTEELINSYKTLLLKPADYGLSFTPFDKVFEKCDVCTSKHKLYELFIEWFKRDLPKVCFYIIMDQVYGLANCKENGDLGYKLQLAADLVNEFPTVQKTQA